MKYFQCQCLECKHIGNVPVSSKAYKRKFVCSKCGSKKCVSIYRDAATSVLLDSSTDIYGEIESELQMDAEMMLPTGWEDDKELKNSTLGFSNDYIQRLDAVFAPDEIYDDTEQTQEKNKKSSESKA